MQNPLGQLTIEQCIVEDAMIAWEIQFPGDFRDYGTLDQSSYTIVNCRVQVRSRTITLHSLRPSFSTLLVKSSGIKDTSRHAEFEDATLVSLVSVFNIFAACSTWEGAWPQAVASK